MIFSAKKRGKMTEKEKKGRIQLKREIKFESKCVKSAGGESGI